MKGHKGILKRSLAICLAMATVITTVYRPDRTAWAETSTIQPDTVTENEIQTEGTNSFGNLLNKELEEKLDEQKENAGYNVFSLEVTGTTVNVELEALEACTLVVGIYDEAGTTMLGSGTADVPEKAESATVTVDIASMPTYFDVKAYLIDSETQAPLCQVFDCPTYTQEMQEFLKKSVNDFDADRVLNLDDSEDNNFAVFQEDVKYIEEQENANQVTTEDEANNTYVIENASEEIQALQPGDTTALEYEAGQVLIIKVASITLDGTTATIVGEDTSLEEVFEYMKIDTESYTGDATVDTSNLEEGITYRGMSTSEEVQAQTVAAEDEMTADQAGGADKEGITLKYDIDCSLSSEHNEVKVSGSVEINVKVNLNLCITPTKQYFEFCIDYKLQTSIGVTGKIKFVFPLGKMEFSPVAGVYIRITPKVEEEFSGSLTLTATLTGRVGASITVGAPAVNLSKSPTLNTSLRIEGRAYIGVVFEPEIVLVCDQLLRAGVAFRVGAALTLKSELLEAPPSVIHGCRECFSGDISVIISATFELCFLNMDSLTVKKTFETRIKLADCHFSLDYDEFQLCPCPRKGYLAKLKVIDKNKKAVPNATITGKFLTKENGVVKPISSVTTDAKGKVNVYMPYGTQTIQVKSNERQMSQTINKLDKREEITITLKNKVPINSTVFPDDNFRKYISQNFDTNGDGVLSEGEIAKVKAIVIYDSTRLNGIEVFYDLKRLYCGNQLSELDVSKNVALEMLICTTSQLSELDVSKNVALKTLHCEHNQLSELDVSKNVALKYLGCDSNKLSKLDVSKNAALEELDCRNNQLGELDVSKNVALKTLHCEHNQLSELDVSKDTALEYLDCSNNQLSELDVSKNAALEDLYCGNNQLSELDVSKNVALKYLDCDYNQLSELDVSKNAALKILLCGNNQLSKLDVSKNVALEDLGCSYNQLGELDVSKNVALEDLGCSYNRLSELDVSKNAALESLGCSSNRLSELDVSKNTALEYLDCRNNQLSKLDVSKNVALEDLRCDSNRLSKLAVSKNAALEYLDCDYNQLSELDVSKNAALKTLHCEHNQLSKLDVSKNVALEDLGCSYNRLSELDVSKNAVLEELDCSDNRLSELDVSKNAALEELDCSYNQLSKLDVSKNTALEYLDCRNNRLSKLDVSKNVALWYLSCDSNVKLTGWPRTTKSSNTANSDAITAESISDLTPEFPGQSGDISDSVKYDQDLEAELATEEETASDSEPLTSPVTYTDLLPNSIYNFYVLKDKEEAISSGNLLYIIQITSDENGQATIPFAYNQSCNSPQAKLVGMEKLDIAGAEVTIEDLYYTGEAQDAEPTVVYKGTALEPGKDYTITGDYQATEIGTYTIQIVGTGLYKGSLEKSYQILPITVAEIKLSQSTLSMKKGETAALTVTITPENATDKAVDWTSSDTKIATVDSTGKVTAVSAGTASITCTAQDGSDKKATCKVTVTDPTPPKPSVVKVAKITLNKTTASVGKGKAMQLTAIVTPTNATNKAVTWKSSNTKIATVSSTGKVTAKAAGTVTITCMAQDGSGKKATCKVTVTESKPPVKPTVKVTKVTLNKKTATLSPKETLTLKATVTPTNATNKGVIWKSSNTKIATVSSTGRVTAKSAGTVTITCTAKDGSGKKATCKITVYNNTQAYVARIYTKALGRAAEPAGLNYWVGEINAKRRTPVQVAEEFFFAPEFVNKKLNNTEYVKVLYRTFMGREYDKGGLDYWVARLNKGESRKSVLEAFAGCPEFKNIVKSFGL